MPPTQIASLESFQSLASRVRSLTPEQLLELSSLLEPRLTKYIPHRPHPTQAAFLLLSDRDALFGGAAGGGKSDALLMSALQYVDVPSYSALLLRRRHVDLVRSDALIPRSHEWLAGSDAHWNGEKKMWTFPSGATLEFGHCEYENDKYAYQGSAWQFIGFDELTHFSETQFLYIGFSRARRLAGSPVPLRTRGSANPGGVGHEWVKRRYIDVETRRGRFVPSRLEDNPSLDRASYEESLAELGTVERRRLLEGDWTVRPKGPLFDRSWFEIVDSLPDVEKDPPRRRARFWDLAATEDKPGTDPDWTVGARLCQTKGGLFYLEHIDRRRERPKAIEAAILATAARDGYEIPIGMEQEGGASGKSTAEHYATAVLAAFSFKGYPKRSDKVAMAELWQPRAERGELKLLKARWNGAWLDEVEAFPSVGMHDDQVDATSGAFMMLTKPRIIVA